MERTPTICDIRVQTFIEQAKSTETMPVIVQVKLPPFSTHKPETNSYLTEAAQTLPSRATTAKVEASIKEGQQSLVQAKSRQHKLQDFLDYVLNKLGLSRQAVCNTLAGTVTLEATPEHLKRLMHEPSVKAILENKQRMLKT